MTNKVKESIRKLCRTCMIAVSDTECPNTSNKQCINEIPVGSKEGKSLMELLQLVQPQIKVDINDSLSKFMCFDCINKLQVTYKFLEKYKEVDTKMHNMLENVVTINDDDSYLESCEENNQFDDNDSLNGDYFNEVNTDDILNNDTLNELDEKLANQLTHLDIEIEKRNVNKFQVDNEVYNDYQDWPEFDDQPLRHELIEYYDNPYSDKSGNECNASENEIKSMSNKINKTDAKLQKCSRADLNTTKQLVQNDSRKRKESQRTDISSKRKEIQKADISSESEDDRTMFQEYENDTSTKILPEKRKTNIKCNTTNKTKKKISRKRIKNVENSILIENEKSTICLESDTSNNLDKFQQKESNETQISDRPSQNKDDNIPPKENETQVDPSVNESETNIKTKKFQEIDIPLQNDNDSILCQVEELSKRTDTETNASSHSLQGATLNVKQKDLKECNKTQINDRPSQNEGNNLPLKENETQTDCSIKESETDINIKVPPKQKYSKKKTKCPEIDIPLQNNDGRIPCQFCEDAFENPTLWMEHMLEDHPLQLCKTKKTDTTIIAIQKGLKDNKPSQNENETQIYSSASEESEIDFKINVPPKQKINKKRNRKLDNIVVPSKNDNGKLPCHVCKAVFENRILWLEHMLEHHPEDIPKRIYKCEHCNKEFHKSAIYIVHLRIHTGETPYLCVECGVRFGNPSSLRSHMNRHKGEKTYECPKCPKKFVSGSSLYMHIKSHANIKPFVCEICGQSFLMACMLRKHKLYHDNIRNFPCEYCDKRFVIAEQARRHMRTHTGEKPYRCKYCDRGFAQCNDHIKHLRLHLGDNVYTCELCPQRFPLARDLRAHFATHKEDDEETKARNMEARMEAEKKLEIKLCLKKVRNARRNKALEDEAETKLPSQKNKALKDEAETKLPSQKNTVYRSLARRCKR